MRFALVTDAYPPQHLSAAAQMQDLARAFVADGHEPVVLVPSEGMRGPWKIDREAGIQVLRLRAFRSRDVGRIRRALTEVALPWMMRRGLRRSPLRDVKFDGVVWLSPSIFFGPLVNDIKEQSGCRGYLILRDMFPEWAVDLGLLRRGLAYRFFKRIERQSLHAADAIGVQAPSDQRYVREFMGASARHIEVLWNWLSDAPALRSTLQVAATPLRGRTIFVYAGNMGVAQNVDSLVDLAESFRAREDVGFLFVGRGSEYARLRARAQALGLRNVLFHEEIPSDEVPALLAQCHVGLLALDLRHRFNNIPGKFLAYARAGVPVLARISSNNDLAALIEGRDLGIVSADASVESLHAKAEVLLNDPDRRAQMGARARLLASELFSPAAAVSQITAALACGDQHANAMAEVTRPPLAPGRT